MDAEKTMARDVETRKRTDTSREDEPAPDTRRTGFKPSTLDCQIRSTGKPEGMGGLPRDSTFSGVAQNAAARGGRPAATGVGIAAGAWPDFVTSAGAISAPACASQAFAAATCVDDGGGASQ